MLCIYNSNTDPYFNLAAEEYVLMNFTEDVFMLWRNNNAIIVGRFQNSAAEINLDFVKEKGVKVVRRLTGGGAVFHDLGNLNYTFIGPKGSGDFRTFSEPILQVLNNLGVPARFEGRNDLMINGQKFSGNAECIAKGRILHHGTLLFASEMEDLSAALKANPLKFQDKAVKSIRKRVTNISEHLHKPMTVSEFTDIIMEHVSKNTVNAVPYAFTPEDIRAIEKLRDEKYGTWEWNFGSSPKFDYSKMMRTSGGNVEVNLFVEKGNIVKIKIFGDFFSRTDITEFENMFVGQPYREDSIRNIIESVTLDDYLCNVTADELVQIFF
ncbi:MAG: lipoate--protein ligase [Bacteroidales bacterium]|nr:lipoate--protein ligase [Bacteroidales bacterium]